MSAVPRESQAGLAAAGGILTARLTFKFFLPTCSRRAPVGFQARRRTLRVSKQGEDGGPERVVGAQGVAQPSRSLTLLLRDTSGGPVKCEVSQLHGTVGKEIGVSTAVVSTSVSPARDLSKPAPYGRRRAESCDLMGCVS